MWHHVGALCSSTFPHSNILKAAVWISILLLKIRTDRFLIKMQWMLNLSLAAQTTKSRRLQHQEFIWKKDLQRSKPSPAVAEMARQKDEGISWGQRPVPAYKYVNWQFLSDFVFRATL